MCCIEIQSNVRPRIALLTLATPGGGLIRRAALYVGDTTLGATVSIPFTYAKSFNPAEARYQDRKSEQNVTAIAHPS